MKNAEQIIAIARLASNIEKTTSMLSVVINDTNPNIRDKLIKELEGMYGEMHGLIETYCLNAVLKTNPSETNSGK